MNVLVTGCTGHLGTAACTELVQQGFTVRGIDLTAPDPELSIDFRPCDLAAGRAASEALDTHLTGIDAVLHLAAIPVPRLGTPTEIFDLNAAATFRLFQACVEADVGHVVVASSLNAIGYYFCRSPFELDYLPVDAAHPKQTSDPYSFSKQITEEVAAYFHRLAGVSSRCLRFGGGLQHLEDLREGLGLRLMDARHQVEALGQLPPQEARSELARLRRGYDAARRSGLTDGTLTSSERSLMGLRHNFFSFIELKEAARAMRLALSAPPSGAQTLFIVDRRNGLDLPAEQLAGTMYPDVERRQPLLGNQSLVSWEEAASIGFLSQTPASELFD